MIDKLVKVFTRDGNEEWILVHVEVQAQYQKDFARRMFTYFYRILDKYQKPITAYAIFTEAGMVVRPNSFAIEYMGTSLRYTFNTYKISGDNDEELRVSNNPFAIVVLTVRASLAGRRIKDTLERDQLLLALKLKLARDLLAKAISKEKIRVLINFLRYYVRFENPDVNLKFDKEVEILTGRSTTMGIEELLLERAKNQGLEEGIEKGFEKGEQEKSHAVVENLILKLGFSDEQAASIAEVSLDFIKKVRSGLKGK